MSSVKSTELICNTNATVCFLLAIQDSQIDQSSNGIYLLPLLITFTAYMNACFECAPIRVNGETRPLMIDKNNEIVLKTIFLRNNVNSNFKLELSLKFRLLFSAMLKKEYILG